MDTSNLFIAHDKALVFYAGKALINKRLAFYDREGNPFDLSFATGFTFDVWEEREGGLHLISWGGDHLTLSGENSNEIIVNAPAADTDIEKGKHYYEINAIYAGGYPLLLAYTEAKFI